MTNFTPISSLLGGLIIGSAVVLYFYTTGRLAGISGIFANGLTTKNNRSSNLLFLLGLVIGPSMYLFINDQEASFKITNSYFLIIAAGFCVGLGTRMSSGCTSGHGICGISRFSTRSITGVITVFVLQQFGLYL
jgi:uncharacterized membrane protein YedE/YeeE